MIVTAATSHHRPVNASVMREERTLLLEDHDSRVAFLAGCRPSGLPIAGCGQSKFRPFIC